MGAYRLHADYDRNGRLTAQDAEWAARWRGAVLRANLDADTRRLPSVVSPDGAVRPDRELHVKTAGDNEPIRVQVELVSTAPPGQVFVVLMSEDAARIAVIDSSGKRIPPVGAGKRARYPLPARPFPRKLALESVDLPASPATNRLLSPAPGTTPAGPPGSLIKVWLERDSATGPVIEDEARFVLAPLVLIGNAGRLERFYMCEVLETDPAKPLDDNGPSVADIRAVLDRLRVPLMLIPGQLHGGDTWIQDQYQLGFTHTPDGLQRVLLHAPRTRSDAAQGSGRNLGSVLSSHFLSQDLGVCQAFWDRELTITDPRGQQTRMTFADSDRALTTMTKVRTLRRQMFETIGRIGTDGDVAAVTKALGEPGADLWKSRHELLPLLEWLKITAQAAAKRDDSPWKGQQAKLDLLIRDADKQVKAIVVDMPVYGPPPQLRLRVPAAGAAPARDFMMTKDEVGRLEERLHLWHSSHNYGGNIEVGPPTKSAPAGVVVVGNVTTRRPDGPSVTDMDPDLLSFLRGQFRGRQDILEVDTSWLDVGHVDEMLAFVPDLKDPHNGLGTVLRASPLVAQKIFEQAAKEFYAGLSAPDASAYEKWKFDNLRTRLNNQGKNPLTHLLRGLQWLHRHNPGQALPTEPPEIYLALAAENAKFPVTTHNLPLPDSPWQTPPARTFPAGISIYELAYFSDNVNADLEDLEPAGPQRGPNGELIPAKGQLPQVEEQLTKMYGSIPIKKIPVFFDSRSHATGQTAAFTPNMANLQVADNHLIIPRPHGPRMTVDSATRVLRQVAEQLRDVDPARFTPQWLRARGLNRTFFWARQGSTVRGDRGEGDVDADKLASAFLDGFPPKHTPAQVRQLIIQANPGAFDASGSLRGKGWRKLQIPEDKVDLFEAWTEAVAERIGYRVHWVEAWYYHVRLGSIHCGTNVLRTAPTAFKWWR